MQKSGRVIFLWLKVSLTSLLLLQDEGEGKGNCDGLFHGTEYFKCKQNCGVFLPCNKLHFVSAPKSDETTQEAKLDADVAVPVKVGDSVGFYLDDHFRRGIVMAVYKEENTWMVKICPVRTSVNPLCFTW